MIKAVVLGWKPNGNNVNVVFSLLDTSNNSCIPAGTDIPTYLFGNDYATVKTLIETAIIDWCTVNVVTTPDEFVHPLEWLPGMGIVNQKIFKANISGGAGNVTFATVDGSGNALYSSLTADQIIPSIDGVSDQYQYFITVASDKKSVTLNAKRQNFTTSNALVNLLGGVIQLLSGVTYVNAADGVGVKILIGIDD